MSCIDGWVSIYCIKAIVFAGAYSSDECVRIIYLAGSSSLTKVRIVYIWVTCFPFGCLLFRITFGHSSTSIVSKQCSVSCLNFLVI